MVWFHLLGRFNFWCDSYVCSFDIVGWVYIVTWFHFVGSFHVVAPFFRRNVAMGSKLLLAFLPLSSAFEEQLSTEPSMRSVSGFHVKLTKCSKKKYHDYFSRTQDLLTSSIWVFKSCGEVV